MTAPVTFESRSFKLEEAAAPPPAAEEPSLSLTASDGVGLVLVALSARVVVEEPLAFTELHLVFQNPEARQLEGRFRIGLPSGATVSRFAMRIGAQWQEGEVVERQAARRAYEDFLHRRQDPALLEHEAGNEFSARVFPIEANARKEIIVSYSHELRGEDDAYRLPLVGLPEIAELSIRALVGRSGARQAARSSLGGTQASWEVVEVAKSRWKPDVDFEVKPAPSSRAGLRFENLVVARIRPDLGTEAEEIGSLLVLMDTSASRALGFERQVEIVRDLVTGLGRGERPSCPVAIACFDQSVKVLFEGAAKDFSGADVDRLRARMALGASDLAGALRWVAERKGQSYERVLLVTDGVATAGDVESDKVAGAAKELSSAGVKRLDVLAVGGLRDDAGLRRLVTAGLERDGTVCDGDSAVSEIAGKLVRATRSGVAVEVPGASWVWPARLDGIQPGDSVLVYADVPAGKPVRVLLDKKPVSEGELALDPAEKPLLERAWVKARIDRMEDLRARPDTDPDIRAGLQKQVIELSVKHRVLSPYTALLVLETEQDYERFHIDRNALSDILTVGLSGVEVLRRTAASTPVFQPAPAPKQEVAAPRKKAKGRPAPEVSALRSRAPGGEQEEQVLFSLSELAREADEEMPSPAQAEDPIMDLLEAPDERTRSQEVDNFIATPAAPAAFAPPPPSYAAPAESAVPAPMGFAGPPPMAMPGPPPMDMPSPRPAAPEPMAPQAEFEPPRAMLSPPSPAPPSASPSPLRRFASAVTDAVSNLFSRDTPVAPPPDMPPPDLPRPPAAPPPPPDPEPAPAMLDSWTGPFRDVMALVLKGEYKRALEMALAWRKGSPGDVLALIAIGESAELLGEIVLAARAYGSLIDLFPSRADIRRFAGERLSRVVAAGALELAIDTYRKAVESRPDHPSSHRLLGMALLRAGRPAEAFEAIAAGQARSYPPKFPGIPRILNEDLGLCAAAWIRAEPERKREILDRVSRAGGAIEDQPSVRFVLVWETDANDVDFHIHDAKGGHAFFREKVLPSGGELYADVTQGYGPECFTIRGAPAGRAYPYKLQAHYYRQGPMGYGMGALQTIEHDGKGGFGWSERPYIVMRDGAFVDLGVVNGPVPITGAPAVKEP